jgi:hypothetical protein
VKLSKANYPEFFNVNHYKTKTKIEFEDEEPRKKKASAEEMERIGSTTIYEKH